MDTIKNCKGTYPTEPYLLQKWSYIKHCCGNKHSNRITIFECGKTSLKESFSKTTGS